ncbi:hypothetical protein KIL84_017188 [Mauremys mutica]|uniref:Uncharacterized protein n=1 Tax=Mauremys mutica TaxID=74926 RepID=A0A9D3X0K0_9SAUR|nr:hypothetical protein KIL84_017188 [Mauremys mutica]
MSYVTGKLMPRWSFMFLHDVRAVCSTSYGYTLELHSWVFKPGMSGELVNGSALDKGRRLCFCAQPRVKQRQCRSLMCQANEAPCYQVRQEKASSREEKLYLGYEDRGSEPHLLSNWIIGLCPTFLGYNHVGSEVFSEA